MPGGGKLSKVVLVTIMGGQALSELSRQYGINSDLIVRWKKQLIDQNKELFASGKGLVPDRISEIRSLAGENRSANGGQ